MNIKFRLNGLDVVFERRMELGLELNGHCVQIAFEVGNLFLEKSLIGAKWWMTIEDITVDRQVLVVLGMVRQNGRRMRRHRTEAEKTTVNVLSFVKNAIEQYDKKLLISLNSMEKFGGLIQVHVKSGQTTDCIRRRSALRAI